MVSVTPPASNGLRHLRLAKVCARNRNGKRTGESPGKPDVLERSGQREPGLELAAKEAGGKADLEVVVAADSRALEDLDDDPGLDAGLHRQGHALEHGEVR